MPKQWFPTFETKLQCTKCNTVSPILRNRGRTKAVGHIKDIYCYSCKEEQPHKELGEHTPLIS